MGSMLELNDTLQITKEQGFPDAIFDLAKHQAKPIVADDVKGRVFTFTGKKNARIYQLPPSRAFLVHNIGGKWLWWGHIEIISQTITRMSDKTLETSGEYEVIKVYDPVYQRLCTQNESPPGLSYFP